MNILKTLIKMGLVENVDFELTDDDFTMLEKSKEELEKVFVEEVEEVLDVDGSILIPHVSAHYEYNTKIVLFTPDNPSLELMKKAWLEVQIEESDIVYLVSLYLRTFDESLIDIDNDSYNIFNGKIARWSFKNIPMPTNEELVALIGVVKEAKERDERLNKRMQIGSVTDQACIDAFKYIQGANFDRKLTSEQKTTMATLFAPALSAINVRRPGVLKSYIESITPDEILITNEMKNDILYILRDIK